VSDKKISQLLEHLGKAFGETSRLLKELSQEFGLKPEVPYGERKLSKPD